MVSKGTDECAAKVVTMGKMGHGVLVWRSLAKRSEVQSKGAVQYIHAGMLRCY